MKRIQDGLSHALNSVVEEDVDTGKVPGHRYYTLDSAPESGEPSTRIVLRHTEGRYQSIVFQIETDMGK